MGKAKTELNDEISQRWENGEIQKYIAKIKGLSPTTVREKLLRSFRVEEMLLWKQCSDGQTAKQLTRKRK